LLFAGVVCWLSKHIFRVAAAAEGGGAMPFPGARCGLHANEATSGSPSRICTYEEQPLDDSNDAPQRHIKIMFRRTSKLSIHIYQTHKNTD